MPISLFYQAKFFADAEARAHKSHHVWGPTLFKALRHILKDKHANEIQFALDQARDIIELRSLSVPHDRVQLLQGLKKLKDDLLPQPTKESNEPAK